MKPRAVRSERSLNAKAKVTFFSSVLSPIREPESVPPWAGSSTTIVRFNVVESLGAATGRSEADEALDPAELFGVAAAVEVVVRGRAVIPVAPACPEGAVTPLSPCGFTGRGRGGRATSGAASCGASPGVDGAGRGRVRTMGAGACCGTSCCAKAVPSPKKPMQRLAPRTNGNAASGTVERKTGGAGGNAFVTSWVLRVDPRARSSRWKQAEVPSVKLPSIVPGGAPWGRVDSGYARVRDRLWNGVHRLRRC